MLLGPLGDSLRIIDLLSVYCDDLVVRFQSCLSGNRARLDLRNNRCDGGEEVDLAERFALPTSGLRLFKLGIQIQDLISSLYLEMDGRSLASHDVPGNTIDHAVKTGDRVAVDLQNFVSGKKARLSRWSVRRHISDGGSRFRLWHWAADRPN